MTRFLQIFIVLIVLIFIFFAIGKVKKQSSEEAMEEMIATDKAFSEMCKQKGLRQSFITFADENVYKMTDGAYPIVGRKALEESFKESNEENFKLEWYPVRAQVAESGDLGYTTGNWKISLQDSVLHGCYVSIWKKQKDGTWKYVLDGGNKCPDPEKNPVKLDPL